MKLKNIIRKVMPNYKSKKELIEDISRLNSEAQFRKPTIIGVDKDIVRVYACESIDANIPIDTQKEMVKHKLMDVLGDHIEWEVVDNEMGNMYGMHKLL